MSDEDLNDVAPGYVGGQDSMWRGIRNYSIGLVLAAMLTAASFYAGHAQLLWAPAIPAALVVLAIAQIGIHLTFFIHITTAPDNTNNTLALAFGVLIVALVLVGSLWIMSNLNGRVMPMHEAAQMHG